MKLQTPETGRKTHDSGNTRPTPENILIIRSASRTFTKAMVALKQEFPQARFTVLTENPETLHALEGIETLLPLPRQRRISWWSYGISKRRHLRQQAFDLAVVLYNVSEGRGYANVEMLALSSGARRIRGYFPDGSFRRLSPSRIFKNSIREQAAFGWVVLNTLTTLFLLTVVGILMAGEAVIRKLKHTPTANTQTKTSRAV